MKRLFLFLCFFLFFLLENSFAETQCSWLFGPGVYGPVTTFGHNFFQSDCIGYHSTGEINLSSNRRISISDQEYPVFAIAASDFDGDNDIDVVSAPFPGSKKEITVWENTDGTGETWQNACEIVASDVYSVETCNLNGDGLTDILVGRYSCEQGQDGISWFSNDDGTLQSWTEHVISHEFIWVTRIGSSDFDDDGDGDVVACSYEHDRISWFENLDGAGTAWEEHEIVEELTGVSDVFVCDPNSDGIPDVAASAYDLQKVCWFENPGDTSGVWTERSISQSAAFRILPCDMNSDGYGDIVAALSNNRIVWWNNNEGTGESWEEELIDKVDLSWGDIAVGDFNADGHEDVFGCGPSASPVYWFKNLAQSGTDWESIIVRASSTSFFCTAADVNNDGETDVLSAGYFKFLRWWDMSEEHSSEGFLESSVLDTEMNPYYTNLLWISSAPYGTSLSLQARASNDFNSMGDWSSELFESPVGLDSVVSSGNRYFQYRVNLSSTDSNLTPSIRLVRVQWSLTDIEEEEYAATAFNLLQNPVSDNVTIVFSLPEPRKVSFSVYDCTGRMQMTLNDKEFVQGENQVSLGTFPTGVYLCRISTSQNKECLRFVVID